MTKKNRPKFEIEGLPFDSEGEAVLYGQLVDRGLKKTVEAQYRFFPSRRWRFDFAIPEKRVAVEVEGGVWINGGHNRGAGYSDNCQKYNTATEAGWKVLRFTTDMVYSLEAINTIERVLRKTSEVQ